jgi:hypothetical protein
MTEIHPTSRPLYLIAQEIRAAWPKPYFGAVPYLQAMGTMGPADKHYGCDSLDSIILGFLTNATTFRGPTAKKLKAELNACLKYRNRQVFQL